MHRALYQLLVTAFRSLTCFTTDANSRNTYKLLTNSISFILRFLNSVSKRVIEKWTIFVVIVFEVFQLLLLNYCDKLACIQRFFRSVTTYAEKIRSLYFVGRASESKGCFHPRYLAIEWEIFLSLHAVFI